MVRLFYSFGILLYTFGLRIAALFGHHKAQLMVRGWRAPLPSPVSRPTAWFHAASLGEFEQARPVLEAYRQRHPDHRIVLTFFSPSGYEVRRNYPLADAVLYLPMDTPRNARHLLDTVKPTVAFFVKYEFWYNYLDALRRRQVPTYLFSAIFRPDQYFFRPWGRWFLRQLSDCFTHLFVQEDASLQLLRSHGISHCSVAGDTRFDRVRQIAAAAESDCIVEAFFNGTAGLCLVCGSTWPPDETLLAQACSPDDRLVVAPHVISEDHLQQIERLFPNSIRYSRLKENSRLSTPALPPSTPHPLVKNNSCSIPTPQSPAPNSQFPNSPSVLIIDNIGLLSRLYRYADIAYIGGGFGVGIHNILEAITFGKPVLFGPNYHKFKEARDILALGGGFSHSDLHQLADNLARLASAEARSQASDTCLAYMRQNLGSTNKILDTIEP